MVHHAQGQEAPAFEDAMIQEHEVAPHEAVIEGQAGANVHVVVIHDQAAPVDEANIQAQEEPVIQEVGDQRQAVPVIEAANNNQAQEAAANLNLPGANNNVENQPQLDQQNEILPLQDNNDNCSNASGSSNRGEKHFIYGIPT